MPLPERKYEYTVVEEGLVRFNYHVEFDKHFYSVEYVHAGRTCTIRATIRTVELYIDGNRVASHLRSYGKEFVTLPEHLPESHKVLTKWNPERFYSWAESIGPNTYAYVDWQLHQVEHPIQRYRTIMGILSLDKTYSHEEMEIASGRALERSVDKIKYYKMTLELVHKESPENVEKKPVVHANIRGPESFKGDHLDA
jgi:hypothetical protein